MGARITEDSWNFSDRTRTNAEIIRQLYSAIREAAGETLVLGCNTVGHLAAGLFELQRTGDDTSGRDWNRTRKMDVNTLAFRAAQRYRVVRLRRARRGGPGATGTFAASLSNRRGLEENGRAIGLARKQ